MKPDFSQFGTWIYVDPDEQQVELIEETLDLDMLCERLRLLVVFSISQGTH